MKRQLVIILAAIAITAGAATPRLNYKRLNAKAQKEYLQSLRADVPWNTFATKFLYAPAFDFPEAPGAKDYLFALTDTQGHRWQMHTCNPKASLSPVWNQIPGGTDVMLAVIALRDGKVTTDTVGRRRFLRDYPFQGPYNTPARPYKEAAFMAMRYVHGMRAINQWKDHDEPDMSYSHNTYACKIMGATMRNEALVAHFIPELRDEALLMGRNVARFLRTISQPKGTPLAYFPPTYYKGLIASARQENQNKTMCMEAVTVGHGLLDLYRETRDPWYLEWALGIADTYVRLQRPDGSLPIKLDLTTGEPVNDACAMLHPLLRYWLRLHNEFGQTRYDEARHRGERWMQDVAVRRFDMTGQFEDCSVLGLQPYENLTNCTAAPLAAYIYDRPSSDATQLQDAEDLMRLSEDQFTHWDIRPWRSGIRPHPTPCVFEQYKYQMSVDASAANVAGGFLSKYLRTGDPLALAKALALTNTVTIMQDACTGQIPTIWGVRRNVNTPSEMWINCSVSATMLLLRMDKAIGQPDNRYTDFNLIY